MKKKLRFKQIVAAPWGQSYSIVGLAEDGEVYVYEKVKAGWTKFAMRQVDSQEVNND